MIGVRHLPIWWRLKVVSFGDGAASRPVARRLLLVDLGEVWLGI